MWPKKKQAQLNHQLLDTEESNSELLPTEPQVKEKKKMRKSFKILIGVCFFLVLLTFVTVLYLMPQKINLTYDAVQYSLDDASYMEKTTIKIDGKFYMKNLFRQDNQFTGNIKVGNYDYTQNDYMFDATFFQHGYTVVPYIFSELSYPTYYFDKDGSMKTNIISLGTIAIPNSFDKLAIYVDTEKNKTNNRKNLIICAPAKTRAEAIEIAKQLPK